MVEPQTPTHNNPPVSCRLLPRHPLYTMTPLHPCPTCGTPTRNPHHCTPPRKRKRNHTDENTRRKLLKQWRTLHGNWCPGTPWCNTPNQPHPTPNLTIDHTIPQTKGGTLNTGWTVMCRTANSRKQHHTTPPPP